MSFDAKIEDIEARLSQLECSHNYMYTVEDLYSVPYLLTQVNERYGIRCSNCKKILKRVSSEKIAAKELAKMITLKQKGDKDGK